jgi:hypothetical protein
MNFPGFPKWTCGKCAGILTFIKEWKDDVNLICINCGNRRSRTKSLNWPNIKLEFIKQSKLLQEKSKFEISNLNDDTTEEMQLSSNESDREIEKEEANINLNNTFTEKDYFGRCLKTLDSIDEIDQKIESIKAQKIQLINSLNSNRNQLARIFKKKRKIEASKFFKLNSSDYLIDNK